MRSNYTPGPYEPGPQGDDKGCAMSIAMAFFAMVAMVTVLVTNLHNRRKHAFAWRPSAHDYAAVAMTVIVAAVLLVMPARAQELGGSQSDSLYLPAVSWTFPMWFTDAELAQAQSDAGYDIDTAQMHTVCTLDASATPPHDLRYSSCEQYYVDGQPTEGTSHYIWWLRLNDGILHGVEVGGTMVQSAGTDAPCYIDDDGEVACG